jgi:hypothetical protein
MDVLIAAFSAWIAAQIALTAPPPPRVVQIDPAAMQQLAAEGDVQLMYRIRALYGRNGQVVYLRKNWDPEQLNDRSELVHELVHHFQTAHNLSYGCNAEREKLAYELQIKWLREQGVEDPHGLLQINDFFIVMSSVCRDADHD